MVAMGDPILSLVRTTSAALLSLLIELQGSTMDFMILNLFGSVVETRSYNTMIVIETAERHFLIICFHIGTVRVFECLHQLSLCQSVSREERTNNFKTCFQLRTTKGFRCGVVFAFHCLKIIKPLEAISCDHEMWNIL